MRYGVLFTEDESLKLEDLVVYYQGKDIKSILIGAINVMHTALIESRSDDG